ncbi:hypothetical protein LRP49_10710 [Enterovibrio sp. ZSDZ35]|uniref:Nucleoside phosphorylase domain-containing protein n=1 Tax=Enterovibrio qingdaonensis TaxID=2899818 RepID=A0ABT5QMG3_9GAMM|nr:hypothetical protein [Enterovibrio sp. ZSDZ35]MDD1781665.1 hypothetical protein [Enterovibrio sp. ZSDZ35]
MSRYTDIDRNAPQILTTISSTHPLPVVDWQTINQSAPAPLAIVSGELPKADMILVTWTSAEWSALDHVMLNSADKRYPDDTEWRNNWFGYAENQEISPYCESPENAPIFYFQLVGIKGADQQQQRVLLVKSQVHLAHPPWISGLEAMIDVLLEHVGAKRIMSTGTAGGGALSDMLGAAIVTNKARILLAKPENESCDYNHQTFTCTRWFPSTSLYASTQGSLMMAMDHVWNATTISDAISELNQDPQNDQSADQPTYTYEDLINAPLNPANLKQAQIKVAKGQPLLTTDFYFIEGEEPSDPYCFLEMDDAVVAHQAEKAGVDYAFIRNVSDPIVVTHTAQGEPIPDAVRGNWSGIIYKRCGFYSSFNSVLMCWAAIAGNSEYEGEGEGGKRK